MRVLLMGGSVFVGRAVLRRLRELGLDVTAVTRGVQPQHWSGVEHVVADRHDPAALRFALRGRLFDAVVDVSAYAPDDVTILLAALAHPPSCYVLISSAAVYDRTAALLPFQEGGARGGDAIWDDYGTQKSLAEDVVTAAGLERVYLLRPPYLYGPENNLERESFIWARAAAGEPIFIPGDGETLIQMCHVEDLARVACGVVVAECDLDPGAYNVGANEYLTLRQFVTQTAAAGDLTPHIVSVWDHSISAREYFPFRNRHLILSTRKIDAAGLAFRRFSEGIADTFRRLDAGKPTIPASTREKSLRQSFGA